jgi:Xaa-Pro aminopeptidase
LSENLGFAEVLAQKLGVNTSWSTLSSAMSTLAHRRHRLSSLVSFPVLLWSGQSSSRNFPANVYPFRASSHFLYFAGLPLTNAILYFNAGQITLLMDDAPASSVLWHGASPTRDDIARQIGADTAYPLSELSKLLQNLSQIATIPAQDAATRSHQSQLLKRPMPAANALKGNDRELATAIATIRMVQDADAIAEVRRAAAVTVSAHRAGMVATKSAETEAQVRATMEQVILAANMSCAYSSIVTVQGEVLHNDHYHHPLRSHNSSTSNDGSASNDDSASNAEHSSANHSQNLLLADVGAETETGWASDVTRTWAVSGKFSPTQRAIYDVVLAAHDLCIEKARPGVEYRDLHLLACEAIATGLVDLGILRGNPADLVEQDAHALFFPHGIGHLLGLDVHDMEDLGDLAGYEAGRQRSDRFGLGYLRLNRPLKPGMLVTIEPGFYQVPAILNDPERREKYWAIVNWERLAEFSDVRGIRIEDDVLVTETGCDVLTAALPTKADEIEALMA